ncbi:MAG: 3-oxoacid CoA-transferase subunit B [Bacillota bacterium]|jgi:acetate CoA/acetoacetate CoA-transferase beta subunit|nr:3-oxoacid CoA-transferase subunit B [Eubacteriales bacterium]MDD3536806.1 3-oxoacid CoA-transferase subunit B [Eubacteriales bacterium]MDD4286574.1 3-oxoacid CoA-transferase subunit B [Eubacteriales bacterium]MDI9492516.1 3-oxoacid CoA-transferase subunit B [Bacillota bacterium]NLV69856.1 3-oxoacid CoA-transferase subunit B [Clostridiales bacterium]
MSDAKAIIAQRVAKELKDGNVVNLGIGLPTMVVNYLPEDVEIIFQSENGIMGMGPAAEEGCEDLDIMNAGAGYVTANPGAMYFDSATSFGIIRGRHVDVTVLGALQVDRHGNLASWIIPGKMVPGMGGSMDLVVGAKKVIIAMQHTQKGNHKILDECTLPYTAVKVVDEIVTEMGVMVVTPEGLLLTEYNPEYTLEQIQEATGAKLNISPDLKTML